MNAKVLKLGLLAVLFTGGLACDSDKSPTQPTPACTFAISPGSQAFGPGGGTGAVTVTTAASCAWSVTTTASWLSITGGNGGNGPGTVSYSVTANGATDSRAGTLTIGGQSHAVSQEGRPPVTCTFAISPDRADFGKDAGSGTFAVTAPDGCNWTAASDAAWLVVSPGGQRSGNGNVTYTVESNREIPGRVATISVADRRFSVTQSGDIGSCAYSVAPVDLSACMPASSVTVAINTQASCPWTATPGAPWLSLPGGTSGTGSAVVAISFPDNYDAPRTGVVMVRWPTPTAGQNVRLAQAGCLYAVTRNAFSFTSAGGTGTFDVIQQSDPITCGGATQDRCIWTAASDVPWITVTSSMPRSGDNPVAFNVAANDTTTPREGRITVRDKVVVISQAGR